MCIRDSNTNAHFLLDQLDILRLVTLLFPIIFFLVAALIMFSTLSRVIDGNRTMIGTLKALGYSDRQIMFYYLGYSQIVVVGASAPLCVTTITVFPL